MTTKSLALPHNASRRSATQALHVVSMPSTLRPSRAHRIRCKESQGSTYGLSLVSLIRLLSRRGPELDSYAMSSLSPSCSTGNHLGQSSPYGTWMPVAMPRPGSRERGYMSLPLQAASFRPLRSDDPPAVYSPVSAEDLPQVSASMHRLRVEVIG